MCVLEAPGPPGEDPAARSARQRRSAVRYATDHVERVPLVVAARVGRMVDVVGVGNMVDGDVGEERPRWAAWAGIVAFWALAVLAIVGLLRLPVVPRRVLLVPVVSVAVTAIAFYGGHRIRAPAEPVVVVAAAIGALTVAGRLARREDAVVTSPTGATMRRRQRCSSRWSSPSSRCCVVAWWVWPALTRDDRPDVLVLADGMLAGGERAVELRVREDGRTVRWAPFEATWCAHPGQLADLVAGLDPARVVLAPATIDPACLAELAVVLRGRDPVLVAQPAAAGDPRSARRRRARCCSIRPSSSGSRATIRDDRASGGRPATATAASPCGSRPGS